MKLLKKIAGLFMLFAVGLTSCKEEVEIKNSLSVSPNTALEFNATGNESVTLTVETDADKWSYTAPEWVITEQKGNTLLVNVQDNELDDSRVGRITFMAGSAENINVNIMQYGINDVSGNGILCSIADENGGENVDFVIEKENVISSNIKVALNKIADEDIEVELSIDEAYLDEYDYLHNTVSTLFPSSSIEIESWNVKIFKGSKEVIVPIKLNGEKLVCSTIRYLIPLSVKVISGDVGIEKTKSRINYSVIKNNMKEVKQLLCFEINEVNPLNVLEYKLEDGSYFFDAVVLFSGNMGWDSGTETVRFNARTGEPVINGNIEALVNEWQTYIKPIRDAGIKVYMGVMPHWTRAAFHTLSHDGCKWFAEEMAQIVKDCQLDGVFLDNEYSDENAEPMTPEWSYNPATPSYFAYQMSKQMDAICGWPTEVCPYIFKIDEVTDHETGEKFDPVQIADIMVADYSQGSAKPCGKMTLKNCTCTSNELNLQKVSMTEEWAKQWKDEGYGWCMWFAFLPDPTSRRCNLDYSMKYFRRAAKGFYDQDIIEPTHYYKKIDEGVYDPNRYSF